MVRPCATEKQLSFFLTKTYMGWGETVVRTPGKSQSCTFPREYLYGPPGKSQSSPASIQCQAIIGLPAKRHLNRAMVARFVCWV